MRTVNVADAKAHLSEILTRIEGGVEVVITRRGRPIARLCPITQARKPIDFKALDALRARQRGRAIPSVQLIRRMRDEKY